MVRVAAGRSSEASYCNWFVIAFIWAVLLFAGPEWKGCDGCLESERIALLEINSFFNNPSYLINWGQADDCCDWDRVSCNGPMVRGRVTQLSLYQLNDPDDDDLGGSKQPLLNASLFLPFQELRRLSLQYSGLLGCMENEGFEKLSALVNLEGLWIDGNRFGNNVMLSLSKLSSLKYLGVSYNEITGIVDMNNNGSGALMNLETLRLNGNNIRALKGLDVFSKLNSLSISGNIELQGISNLTTLQSISLDSFTVSAHNTTLLQNLRAISSLRALSFASSSLHYYQGWPNFENLESLAIYNSIVDNNLLETVDILMTNLTQLEIFFSSLDSTIPQALCNLSRLQILQLPNNNLRGELPQCLSNLTSLRSFDISLNQLSGDISKSPLATLSSLEMIDITDNQFRLPLSMSPFFNHSRLETFYAPSNKIYRDDDDHYQMNQQGAPIFRLTDLSLSRVKDDGGYVGSVPKFLYYQTNLEVVFIINVKMKGDVGFPFWLLANNTNLQQLVLSNCSLSGSFQLPFNHHHHPQESLNYLDISDNDFYGSIPPHICAFLPNIQGLYLSNNQLSGNIPEQLSNCSLLKILDARNNILSGEIPRRIWNMSQLNHLDLSSNSFSESLPSDFISPRILTIHLSRNKLGGALSGGADDHYRISGVEKGYALFRLQVLDLSHNHFTGTFPKWTAQLPQLSHLLLNNNEFHGEVLAPLCLELLKLIDVSHNRLSGRLSSALASNPMNCNRTRRDELQFNVQGLEFVTKTNLYTYNGMPLLLMSGLDFSDNKFTGEIPPQIGHLGEIKVLNLSHNKLSGPIPPTFSELIAIESLDLSHNSLSGVIPPRLTELNSLSSFSVAYNNLSGRCPEKVAQFATFGEDSYQGNPLLMNCSTLPRPTPNPFLRPTTTDDDNDGEEEGYIDMESFYASGGVTFVMVLLVIASVLYINPYWRRVWFYCVGITATSCYYFVVDHLPVPAKYKVWELRV